MLVPGAPDLILALLDKGLYVSQVLFRDQLLRDRELHTRDSPDLLKNLWTANEFVFRKNKTKDAGTQPPGRNRVYDCIGIQENPHDTSRNTSSSVRYPRASAKGMILFRSASN